MVNATFSVADGIGRISIEREEALNSIDLETKEAIIERLSDYEDDEDVRAVLFETEGDRAFTAGGDLKEVVDLDFYVVLGHYMLAAVCEMFYARYLNGHSDDPLYPQMEALVPEITRRAKAIIDGERSSL